MIVVMNGSLLRIMIEIDPGAEPIVGALSGPDGERHPFFGWVGLAAAVEALIDGQQPRDPGASGI